MKKYLLLLSLINLAFSAQSQQSWNLTGNGGTNPVKNFVGTRDNNPLRFRINNQYSGEIDSASTRTFFGYGAGTNTIAGTHSVGFGLKALYSNSSGQFNSAFGNFSLYSNTTGTYNTAVGYAALYSNTTGKNNSAFGYLALYNNTTGFSNDAIGWKAMYSNTTGIVNEAIGAGALYSNTSGIENIAIGSSALYYNTTGQQNVAVGPLSLSTNTTGSFNVACGRGSLTQNTTGYNNTAIGFSSQYLGGTGFDNTSVGVNSLYRTNGNYNVGVGSNALGSISNSWYNTAIGYAAGSSYDLGYNNTILGANCGGSFDDQYNMVAIGQGVICPDNSTARIGNSATWSIGGWADWSNFSDGRYKKEVQENVKGLDFIMKLRPVTYHLDVTALSKQMKENNGQEWNAQMKTAIADKEKTVLTGFVAQEVEQAAKETGFDFSGIDKPRKENGLYALRYAEFVVPIVKAMQEQQQLIKDLQDQVEKLQTDVAIVIRENIVNEKVSAYPNPATDNNMTIAITTRSPGQGSLQLFDATGRLIKQMNISIQKGENTINLSLPGIATGSYDVKLDWGKDMHKHITIIKD